MSILLNDDEWPELRWLHTQQTLDGLIEYGLVVQNLDGTFELTPGGHMAADDLAASRLDDDELL
jgi:hypothetical protein